MRPLKPKPKEGPEAKIQAAVIQFMVLRGWYCKETHGNMYQSGFPDLFCCHKRYGQRWVEIKNPSHYVFTPAQLDTFPQLCANGSGVWIMVEAVETEYEKLFGPPNWYTYLI